MGLNIQKSLKNYIHLMRLDKPIGILLLLWPTLWAVWKAGNNHPDIKIVIIFILGVIIMRSAGCVINDIADRKFDKYVARTQHRPITDNKISVKSALVLFLSLLFLGLLLILQLNNLTKLLALIALFLACLYPYTKRFLDYPQLFLGLAFAMGIPMAYTAQLNSLDFKIIWPLYLVGVLWPLMYDTEYAMVDRADDLKIKIKSTAVLLKNYDIYFIGLLQLIIMVLLYITGLRLSLVIIGLLFLYQLYLIKNRLPKNCFNAFLNNQWVGLMIFVGSLYGC